MTIFWAISASVSHNKFQWALPCLKQWLSPRGVLHSHPQIHEWLDHLWRVACACWVLLNSYFPFSFDFLALSHVLEVVSHNWQLHALHWPCLSIHTFNSPIIKKDYMIVSSKESKLCYLPVNYIYLHLVFNINTTFLTFSTFIAPY